MGEDIRRRVVTSFKNAIDSEQNNNDVEAYRKYLDGVALVAAALQQDAECTWVSGKPNLSDKERKSLLGFAKQSVDRLIFLLEKQEPSNIFQGTTNISTPSRDNLSSPSSRIHHMTTDISMPSKNDPISSPSDLPHIISRLKINVPEGNKYSSIKSTFVEQQDEDVSPIARMRKENNLLMTRFTARLRTTTTKSQRHNLQLELQRRLMENSAIAQQQQEAWEKQRSKVTAWCLQKAEEKFKIKEKIECGSITEDDFKKQRLFAAALQYEEEHLWLKRLKQDLLLNPKDEDKQRDIVAHTLNDRLHPFGGLMSQMQHAILNKVHPLIKNKIEAHTPTTQHTNINKKTSRNLASSEGEILEGDGNQTDNSSVALNVASEENIAKEESAYCRALKRHFHNIADDMKQDVKLLEILLCASYEALMTEPGADILTELLHELYFPPIKQAIINLIRLSMADAEKDLAYRMSLEKENKEMADIDEDLVRSCCHALYRLTCLGSPCQMLDSLTAILKTLAVPDDPQAKSIGADDLLPRLMTVVMSSGMPNLLSEAVYMENFMPVNRALGEAGYCLTVLQSVMTCVQVPTG